MPRRVPWLLHAIAAVLASSLLCPSALHAQGTARSMDIDTSIRAAGMGGAGAGVGWGGPSLWGNPAALALVRGFHWEHGRTQLVPGLADDVFLDSDRALLGVSGLAVSSMGEPLGGLDLDYGENEATDGNGNVTGTFRSYERVESKGVAVSVVSLIDGLRRLRGQDSALSAFGDFSYGIQRKRAELNFGGFRGKMDTDAEDWGVLARISPLHPGFPQGNSQFTLDLGYGAALLSANDVEVDFEGFGASPVTRTRRTGGAFRIAFEGAGVIARGPGPLALIADGAVPLVELSMAFDDERVGQAVPIGARSPWPSFTVHRRGFELGVANMAFVRFGHVEDRVGDIVGDTFGWGLQLPLADVAGVRFDHATMPQSPGLEEVKRNGWSMWLDPLALVRRLRQNSSRITS